MYLQIDYCKEELLDDLQAVIFQRSRCYVSYYNYTQEASLEYITVKNECYYLLSMYRINRFHLITKKPYRQDIRLSDLDGTFFTLLIRKQRFRENKK